MNRIQLPLLLALVFALILISGSAIHGDAADDLRDLLVGRTAVFKMEMPLIKGVVVSPDGQLDEKLYYKRIKKHRPVFTPGERAEITRVVVEDSELKICFNNCGIKFLGPGSRVMGKLDKHGSALIVAFPGPVTVAAADPALIVPVLEAVATVEGLDLARIEGSEARTREPQPKSVAATLELLSVTAEPAEVRPGETVRLVLQFELLGAGLGTPVTEERQIYRDDVALLDAPVSSTELFVDGRKRTQLEFQIPSDAAAGAYAVEGVVRGAGVEKSGRAVFLVRR